MCVCVSAYLLLVAAVYLCSLCINKAVVLPGGLHQVPGPLLCPRDCNICDWHHYNHCAVLQICKLRLMGFHADNTPSFHHFNDRLLLQIFWLHMLYAALGAIAFTLVSMLFKCCTHSGCKFFRVLQCFIECFLRVL